MVTLYTLGAVGNALWVSAFNDRLYVAKDAITFFVPILPFGWWAIDEKCGGQLLGDVKMWHLQIVWASMAIAIFSLAYVITIKIEKGCLTRRCS